MRKLFAAAPLFLSLFLGVTLFADDWHPDFSGNWVLDRAASNLSALGSVEASLSISQTDAGIQCSAGGTQWFYALDGKETRKRMGSETRDFRVKWEGAALLINTVISGPPNYSVFDRWELSRDQKTLRVERQVSEPSRETEGRLIFRREGAAAAGPASQPDRAPQPAPAPQPALAKRSEPGLAPDLTVPIGTRVLLALVSEVSTKRAHDGDRVYLRTDAPVAVEGRVVIPRGSDVAGTITHTKPAGKVKGKGELFIRFDSLILPNGVSRDFHARPSGDEGKVEGDGRAADPHTVMAGAGIGATVGAITKGLPGAGIGGAAGALAGVLMSRNQDVVLRPGTHVEMVLDRDLVFHPDELRGGR